MPSAPGSAGLACGAFPDSTDKKKAERVTEDLFSSLMPWPAASGNHSTMTQLGGVRHILSDLLTPPRQNLDAALTARGRRCASACLHIDSERINGQITIRWMSTTYAIVMLIAFV